MTKKDKIIAGIASLVAAIAFVLLTGEAESADTQLLWSGSWMAVFAICAKVVEKHTENEEEA